MLKDQRDLLSAFNAEGVEYLVIGGHAVGIHAEPRATKDPDVVIRNDTENSVRVLRALRRFGAPLSEISADDFCDHSNDVFQIGIPPARVDILQSISGVAFNEAWKRRITFKVDGDLDAPFIALEDLIDNKIASGRLQDLADADKLSKAKSVKES
ncbi:MAG: hypothetical protein HIU91_10550 [Acidobacteria bacterium]|nr:hypothetical protein [Acidobacteriota bacterium]